jgi:hypothetical protein
MIFMFLLMKHNECCETYFILDTSIVYVNYRSQKDDISQHNFYSMCVIHTKNY